MRAALYLRVSKDEQHAENQLPELEEFAGRHGWEMERYIENASAKAGGRRPVLDRLLRDAEQRKFDVVLVWKIDRFGRSLSHFVENVRLLDAHTVRFIAITQGIDTDQRSPFAKLLMHLLAIFAEFERDLIIERVLLGQKEYRRAYAAGRIGADRVSKSGKNLPIGRPHKIFRRDVAAEMRRQGQSWRRIAKELGVPQSTIRLALQQVLS